MMLPSELRSGQPFKSSVVRTINDLIKYLRTQRIITDGKTIVANQGSGGVCLSVPLKQVAKKGGSATELNHPWKMSIITDEYDEQKLMIEDARIEIDGGHPDRVYFENMEYDLPDEADEYYVIGYAVYDPDAADGETSINHTWGVFYMNSDATTADISNTYGFHTFLIGTLIVEDAGGESSSSGDLTYSIGEQYLTSCLNIFDEVSSAQFGCHLFMTSYPQDGSVVETFLGTRVAVNGGQLFIEDTGVSISDVEQSYDGSLKLYAIEVDPVSRTASVVSFGEGEWSYFDAENAVYNVPIAVVDSYTYGYSVEQCIYGIFYFSIGGKVLLNDNDYKVGFLQDKLHYDVELYDNLSSDEKQIYVPENAYIRGITFDSASSSGTQGLYDELYWDYSAIADWNKDKDYLLGADKGELKWSDYKVKVSNTDQKDYLNAKFEDTQGTHWTFTNNKCKVDITGLGKVKVNASDTMDFLGAKVESSKHHLDIQEVIPQDSSSSASEGEIMAQKLDINLNVQGDGIVLIQGDSLSVIDMPTGNSVLAYINGEFTWIGLGDCDSPCGSSSSSSGE